MFFIYIFNNNVEIDMLYKSLIYLVDIYVDEMYDECMIKRIIIGVVYVKKFPCFSEVCVRNDEHAWI